MSLLYIDICSTQSTVISQTKCLYDIYSGLSCFLSWLPGLLVPLGSWYLFSLSCMFLFVLVSGACTTDHYLYKHTKPGGVWFTAWEVYFWKTYYLIIVCICAFAYMHGYDGKHPISVVKQCYKLWNQVCNANVYL